VSRHAHPQFWDSIGRPSCAWMIKLDGCGRVFETGRSTDPGIGVDRAAWLPQPDQRCEDSAGIGGCCQPENGGTGGASTQLWAWRPIFDLPGTISLRLSTFLDAVEDIVRSVYGYGFRRLLVLNGHGGNDPARAA